MEGKYPVKLLGMTVEEAAGALRCSPQFVRNLLNSGELKGRMVGKTWQVTERSVIEWLERGRSAKTENME